MVLKGRLNLIIIRLNLEDETYLLICTDGLSNKVDAAIDAEILFYRIAHLREKTEALVDLANKMGGEDNISVILLEPSECGGDGSYDWQTN